MAISLLLRPMHWRITFVDVNYSARDQRGAAAEKLRERFGQLNYRRALQALARRMMANPAARAPFPMRNAGQRKGGISGGGPLSPGLARVRINVHVEHPARGPRMFTDNDAWPQLTYASKSQHDASVPICVLLRWLRRRRDQRLLLLLLLLKLLLRRGLRFGFTLRLSLEIGPPRDPPWSC